MWARLACRSHSWDFGDGNSADNAIVAHTYAQPGVYTATVTVSNSVSHQSQTTTILVEAGVTGLTAVNNGPIELNDSAVFTAAITTGTNVNYNWSFGDGNVGTGIVASHTYTQPGVYTATVTANNAVSTQNQTLSILVEQGIIGLTAINNSPIELSETAVFTASIAAGSNVSYSWDFGDGTTATGIVASHTYTQPNLYTATVTANNLVSQQTETITILVEQTTTGITASNNGPIELNDTAIFTASVATGTNVVYSWDFGDGNNGSGAVATHNYRQLGLYTVRVRAENGVSVQTRVTVILVKATVSQLTASNNGPIALSETAVFTANLNAGSNVTYTQAGTYTVTVTASNAVTKVTEQITIEIQSYLNFMPIIAKTS